MVSVPLPPLSYVEVGFVILFIAFVERMLHTREHLMGSRAYFYASYIGLLIVTIGMFGGISYSGNILLMRTSADGNSGHVLSVLAIWLVLGRFGYKDIIKGLATAGGFVGFHEAISVGTTIIAGAYGAGVTISQALFFYSTFFFLLSTVIIAYFVIDKRETWRPMYIGMGLLVLYSAIVVITTGAQGTLNVEGPTALFGNLMTNAIEDFSWMMPCIAIIVASLFGRQTEHLNMPLDEQM